MADDILSRARTFLQRASLAEAENRQLAEADIRMVLGDQWDEAVKAERAGKRPMLVLNRLPQFLDQVMGDQRRGRPSIKVLAAQAAQVGKIQKVPNVGGTAEYTYAEVLEGVVRSIESLSNAEDAYDTAFAAALTSGFGAFRILPTYPEDEVFEQDISIQRIQNPMSVYWDPLAVQLDRSDANEVLLTSWVSREMFKIEYPEAQQIDAESAAQGDISDWYHTESGIRVAEYYWRTPVQHELVLLSDGRVVRADALKGIADELARDGITEVRRRKVRTYRVQWAKLSGADVLEGPLDVPCRWIPVIVVLGKELWSEGRAIYRSLIRHAHDAQRQYNFWSSAMVERVALEPRAPFVVGASQLGAYGPLWKKANTEALVYLPYDDTINHNPPQRVAPPVVSPGMQALTLKAADDIKATIGMYDAALGQRSNETSGRAIAARDAQSDTMSYAFLDNLSKSIRHAGRILVDMIPQVYDSSRVVRILGVDGTEDFVAINQSVIDEQTGREVLLYDLSAQRYQVRVDVGPSYRTQRQEASESLIEFMRAVGPGYPQAVMAIADLIAANQDWPGADGIAERLRRLGIAQGIIEPDPEDGEAQAQPAPPDPMQAAQARVSEVEMQARYARAKADEARAKAEMVGPQDDERLRNAFADLMAEYLTETGQAPAASPLTTRGAPTQ